MKQTKYTGVYEDKKHFYTVNFNPGHSVYFENLINFGGKEYREWVAKRSKLCAGFKKNINILDFKKDSNVLYLGASTGTTVSHVSDICTSGKVFAVEFSSEVFKNLYFLADKRRNIFPILANANKPEGYYHRINACDIVYQDIAQRNQVEIFEKNIRLFLKNNGVGILCVKARSIDVTQHPKKIFEQVREQLKESFKIIDQKYLEPFQKDHIMFVVKKI